MSSPGGQGGGQQGGSGSGGSQSNPTTTTTSAFQATTSSSTSTSVTHTSSTPTPTASSTSSSNTQRTAIIGGVLGGVAAILLITFITVWCLTRRRRREKAKNAGQAQPVTYTGLNSAFAGVPFRHSPHSAHASSHNSLLPAPLALHQSDPNIRGGASSPGERTSATETDRFLPSYAQSQADMSMRGVSSYGRTSTYDPPLPPATVSPLSTRAPHDAFAISPQTTGGAFPPRSERDTMGFPVGTPVEEEFSEIRLPPEIITPIVSPIPRRPLVHQDSLERTVREGLLAGESPEPSLGIQGGQRDLTEENLRDSTVLGNQNMPRIHQPPPSSNRWAGGLTGELGRNASQRTVSSISSMPTIISDTELERMGVGRLPIPPAARHP